ncbi:UbiA family prenyltransferase [Streptomyces sp. ET3-23]|uniref:UbiA family prenyltransferase n=1 Tax=Streptomyces sp. ET3-23 TaxID=2885643 RepID=UPI001D11A036|nr:UbiA family prenyltransferase [Streptomyces sp. ET3-23]MCC2280706.1 UbiA family prenyltransferase [Streptomyces sp. ET3-23]
MAGTPRNPAAVTAPAPDTVRHLARTARAALWHLGREPWLSWRFIRNDPWAGFYPGVVFTLAVGFHYRLPPGRFAVTAVASVVYFWLYLYTFCLTNQLAGMREDQINKPSRPLVEGDTSRQGAFLRTGVTFVAFPLAGWALGVWQWALIWQAMTLLHNLGGSRRWVVKNAVIGFGVLPMLGPAWQMTAPLTADAWRWMLALAIPIFFLIPVQDLRDLHGDATTRRMTFPIAFGETFTRRFLCAGFALLPLVDHFLLIRASCARPLAWFAEAATAALCWTIAWRVARRRTPAYDHRTYRCFEYWYTAVLATAFIAL